MQASATEVRDVIEKGVAEAVTFPVGLDPAVRHRQGHEVPHGRAALRHDLRLGDEQGELRWDVGGAEEGDRRPLHQRMGRRVAAPWADFEHAGVAKLKARPGHEVYTITDAQLAEWKKAAEPLVKAWADSVQEGRRRPGCDPEGPEGDARALQGGLLTRHAGTRDDGGEVSRRRHTCDGGAWRKASAQRHGPLHRFDRVDRGIFVGVVAADVFISVMLRYFFSI